jgi:hypothetical protein
VSKKSKAVEDLKGSLRSQRVSKISKGVQEVKAVEDLKGSPRSQKLLKKSKGVQEVKGY